MNKLQKGLLKQQIILLRSAIGNNLDDCRHVAHITYAEIFEWLDDILGMVE